MTYKTFSLSLLEEIEKKKIDAEIVKIKHFYLTKEQNNKQLKLLIDYQKEYLEKIYNQMTSGVCIHQWRNYNNFIYMLQVIIQDNINRIAQNEKIIKERVQVWSKNKIKLKVWKYLNTINKKQILKMKKIQEDMINDNYMQLIFLKKG